MPTKGFVCSSFLTVFINPNASSPKIDLYLGIVCWRRICSGHRFFCGTWLDNHPFYLRQLKVQWRIHERKLELVLFFDFINAVPKIRKIELQLPVERELLPENSVKSWYQYNWGVYGEKAFTSNTQRALQTSPCSSCCSESIVNDWKWFFHRRRPVSVEMTRNSKFILFYFPSP